MLAIIWFVAVLLAVLADTITTYIAISDGSKEFNPFPAFLFDKLGLLAGSIILLMMRIFIALAIFWGLLTLPDWPARKSGMWKKFAEIAVWVGGSVFLLTHTIASISNVYKITAG